MTGDYPYPCFYAFHIHYFLIIFLKPQNSPIPTNKGDNGKNKQGIAETAKTNGPTCDNTCIKKI